MITLAILSGTNLILLIIIGALLAIYFSVSLWIYRKVLINYNKQGVDLVDHNEPFYQESYQWFQEIPKEEVTITSYDSLKLHAYYIPSYEKKAQRIAIVVHGYQSKATDMIIIGKMYAKMGFQVLLTDLRGHGKSEGTFTSFGYYERYDLKKWINYALRTYGANSDILIHGVSMGAATTLMTTMLDIPKSNLKFMVLDSGFTRIKKTFTNISHKLLWHVFYPGVNLVTYMKHRFTLYKVKPLKAMKKNTIPFLIVQGGRDKAVPVSMARQLFDASPAIKKDLIVIAEAKHALGFKEDFEACYEAVYNNIKPIFNIRKTYE